MFTKTLIAAVSMIALSSLAYGEGGDGHGPGNGGDGLRKDGKIYVLDLVEAGVEESPYFNPDVQVIDRISSRVETALFKFPEITSLVSHKLSEINAVSPITALHLLNAIESYSFVLARGPLVNIPDEDSVLQWDEGELVQLAIRRNSTITVDRDLWKQMAPEQKTALIFHEIVYAAMPPHCEDVYVHGEKNESCSQSSARAREIVGFMFSPAMGRGFRGFKNVVKGALLVDSDSFRIPFSNSNVVCIGLNHVGIDVNGYEIPASFFRRDRYVHGFEDLSITAKDPEQITQVAESICSHVDKKSEFKARGAFRCDGLIGLPEFTQYQEYDREAASFVTKSWFGLSEHIVFGYSGDGKSYSYGELPNLLKKPKEECIKVAKTKLEHMTWLFFGSGSGF